MFVHLQLLEPPRRLKLLLPVLEVSRHECLQNTSSLA